MRKKPIFRDAEADAAANEERMKKIYSHDYLTDFFMLGPDDVLL